MPDAITDYQELCNEYLPAIDARKDIPIDLMGSFKVWYGETDQAIHLWKYRKNEYSSHAEAHGLLTKLPEFQKFKQERAKMLMAQRNDLIFEVSCGCG